MNRQQQAPLYVDIALYGLSAAFAGYTALWSTLPAHKFWGAIAIGGYAPAAIASCMLLFRYAVPIITRMWISVAASAAVTLMPLMAAVIERSQGVSGRAQEEVLVVEASAQRFVESGTPYLSADSIAGLDTNAQLLAYNPYQPGMAVFGLPHAGFGAHWFTDARIWFAAVTLAATWVAIRMLVKVGMPRPAWVRVVQSLGVLPICALTLATGGDDLPVVALATLAFSCVATKRYLLAGFVIGAAAAMKLFAWPVLIVVLIVAYKRGALKWLIVPAVGIPVLSTLPVMTADWSAFIDNVIDFPLGNGVIASPAASPLPGYLIATYVPGGDGLAVGLLLAAGLVVAGCLLWWPPRNGYSAAAWCAVGLAVAMVLMPSSRFGYLIYPAVFGMWWWVLSQTEVRQNPWDNHIPESGTLGQI